MHQNNTNLKINIDIFKKKTNKNDKACNKMIKTLPKFKMENIKTDS